MSEVYSSSKADVSKLVFDLYQVFCRQVSNHLQWGDGNLIHLSPSFAKRAVLLW